MVIQVRHIPHHLAALQQPLKAPLGQEAQGTAELLLSIAEAELSEPEQSSAFYLLLHKLWTGELVRELDRVDLVSVVCEEMDHLKETPGELFPTPTQLQPTHSRGDSRFPAHGTG